MSITNKLHNIDIFEEFPCTYHSFGHHDVSQNCYYCSICDPKKDKGICFTCYNECHKNCKKQIITQDKVTLRTITCHCGKDKKHQVQSNDIEDDEYICSYFKIEHIYKQENFYHCNDHNCDICSTCYQFCHSTCDVSDVEEKSDKKCCCEIKDEFHGKYNQLVNMSCLIKYRFPTVKVVNAFQVINVMFSGGCFKKLLLVLYKSLNMINEADKGDALDRWDIKIFLDSFWYNSRHMFKLDQKLMDVLDYNLLMKFFFTVDNKNTIDTFFTYYMIPYLILFSGLKLDFQDHRRFKINDYLTSTFEERRLMMVLYRNTNSEAYMKYLSKDNPMKKNFVDLIMTVAEAFDKKWFIDDMDTSSEYRALFFDMILYSISLSLLTIEQLVYIVKGVFRKYEHCCEEDITKKYYFHYAESMIKTIYAICVSYNDMITINILENRQSKYKYLHYKSEHSEILLKAVLRLGEPVKVHLDKLTNKLRPMHRYLIVLYNDILKFFVVADNSYHFDLRQYEKYLLSENHLAELERKILNLNKSTDRNIMDTIEEFNASILRECDRLYDLTTTDINLDYINQLLKKFLESCNRFTNTAENPKLTKHQEKVMKLVNQNQLVLSPTKVNPQQVSILVDYMVLMNTDMIVTKLLLLVNTQIEDDIRVTIQDNILTILSIMLFTKQGTIFLTKSKPLSRIFRTFKSNEYIFEFLYILMKAININKQKFAHNKYVYTIATVAINEIADMERENICLVKLTKCFKILENVSKLIDYEEFIQLKTTVFNSLNQKQIITFDFKNNYSRSQNSQRDDVDNDNPEHMSLLEKEANNDNQFNKLVEENNEPVNTDNKENPVIKLLISIIRFINIHNDIVYLNTSYYDELHKFLTSFNIENVAKLITKNFFCLEHKAFLFEFLVRYYFIEVVPDKNTIDQLEIILSPEEYKTYLETENLEGHIKIKLDRFNNMIAVIEIFTQELEMLTDNLDPENNGDKKHINNLLNSLKYISDFIYGKKSALIENMCDHIILPYYELILAFSYKADLIVKIRTGKVNKPKSKEANKPMEITKELLGINDFFNLHLIYNCFFELYNYVYSKMGLTDISNFSSLLQWFDRKQSFNTFTVGIKVDGVFKDFYNSKSQQKASKKNKLINNAIDAYNIQFKDFHKSAVLKVLNFMSIEEKVNYRELIVSYFVAFIDNQLYITEDFKISLFSIFTKLLYFDAINMQKTLSKLVKESFFSQIYYSLNISNNQNFFLHKNIYNFERYKKIILAENALLYQFIQLLGEGYCTKFTKYITGIVKVPETQVPIIYPYLTSKKKYVLANFIRNYWKQVDSPEYALDYDKYMDTDREDNAPDDEGKVLEDLGDGNYRQVNNYLSNRGLSTERLIIADVIDLLRKMKNYMLINDSVAHELPYDNLIIQFTSMVTFIVEHSSNFTEELIAKFIPQESENIITDIENIIFNRFTAYSLKRQHFIQYIKVGYLKILIALIQTNNLAKSLNYLLKHIDPIRLFEEIIYYSNKLLTFYKDNSKIGRYITLASDEFNSAFTGMYVFSKHFQESIDLKFCLFSFKFLKILGDMYKVESVDKYYKDNMSYLTSNKDKKDNSTFSIAGLHVYQVFSDLVRKVEISADNDEDGVNIFYIRHPITFMLTSQSRRRFFWNVDRSSTLSKLTGLISETDYFIYEMLYNYSEMLNRGSVAHFFSRKLFGSFPRLFKQLKVYEVLNIILVLVQQIILLTIFFKPIDKTISIDGFTAAERFTAYPSNFVLAIIQIVYVSIVILMWVRYYSFLSFQYLVMKNHNVPFLIDNSSKETKFISFTSNFIKDNTKLFNYINKQVRFKDKAWLIMNDLIINNNNINTLCFTFILLLAYLISGNNLCLAIPILFIGNLSDTLTGIVSAIKLKWKQLLLVIFFIYLIVYLYSWIAFLYLSDLLNIDGLTIPGSVNLY
jgi:hypothetical protein